MVELTLPRELIFAQTLTESTLTLCGTILISRGGSDETRRPPSCWYHENLQNGNTASPSFALIHNANWAGTFWSKKLGLGIDGEPSTVVVREPETLTSNMGSEHTVLLSEMVGQVLLLAVDPASII